jgi:hypothetical protein
LLISVDGMPALDFAICQKGVPDSGNQPYCPWAEWTRPAGCASRRG